MSSKRLRKLMEKLDSCDKVVQQSRSGITAANVAKQLNIHRATAHSYLNSLEIKEKVYSQHGVWYPKDVETPGLSKHKYDEPFRQECWKLLSEVTDLWGQLDPLNKAKASEKLELLIRRFSQSDQDALWSRLNEKGKEHEKELDKEEAHYSKWVKRQSIFQGEEEERRIFNSYRRLLHEETFFRDAVNEISNLLHES